MAENRHLTRRQLLQGGAVLGAGAVVGLPRRANAASMRAIAQAALTKPAGSDLGAIEHVVFLMQENRSFDHYFGAYPGVRGFDDHPKDSYGAFAQPYAGNKTLAPNGVLLPYHMDIVKYQASCTGDLGHGWGTQHACWNDGKMDSFVSVHTSGDGPIEGLHTMGYYTREDIPFYWALADAFTLCDNYHCSVMGPTHPNRLMAVSGTVDPAGTHGGPILETNSDPTVQWTVDWTSMPEVLEDAGISWKAYSDPLASPAFNPETAIIYGDSVFMYFKAYENPLKPFFQKAFLPEYPADFALDVARDTLPAVSWIISNDGVDEHPPAPSWSGEWFVSNAIKTLASNPKVWAKTVLFVMYDENDGFFDHVAPPVAPKGTPGEYVTKRPLPADADGVDGPIGLGFRVPMHVVSPFSRGGHIASEVFDHTSQLQFIGERWGVEVPNVSKWRRENTGDLTSALHMNRRDLTVPVLPSTSKERVLGDQQCSPFQDLELFGGANPVPAPDHRMPHQERR
jgi:phospholipase C